MARNQAPLGTLESEDGRFVLYSCDECEERVLLDSPTDEEYEWAWEADPQLCPRCEAMRSEGGA